MTSPGMPSPPDDALSARALFKHIAGGSGLYFVVILAQRLVSIILVSVTTRFLSPTDYGVLELLEQISIVLAILLGTHLSSALGYFFTRADSREGRDTVVATTSLGALGVGTLALLICFPFAGALSQAVFRNPAARYYLLLIFLMMPANFLVEALFSWLRVENRMAMFMGTSLFRLIVQSSSIVVMLAVFQLQIAGMLYANLIAVLSVTLLLVVYCVRRTRIRFEYKLLFRVAKYAAPLGLSGLAMFIMHFGDRFILPRYQSFAELGIYALAYKIGMLLSSISASFFTYWSAQSFQIMGRKDADMVFARICTYAVLGISFCSLGIALSARPALQIMVAPAYQRAAAFVPVIVTAYAIRSIGELFRCLFLVAGRPGYDAICTWAGSLVCLTGYFLLIPRFGAWGAAGATLAAFSVFTATALGWTYQLRPYHVENGRLAKIGVAVAAAILSHVVLPASSLSGQIGSSALSLALFPLTLWLLRFPTAGEWQVLRAALQSLASRRFGILRAET